MARKCIGNLLFWLSMNDIDHGAFRALFEEACLKCFGHVVATPLTETESKVLYNKVFEETGLVIGWKSIKNYSAFLFSGSAAGKPENPSVATLDTLSRYVQSAPYTTEAERKRVGGHFPFWFGYREFWVQRRPLAVDRPVVATTRGWWWMGMGFVVAVLAVVCGSLFFRRGAGGSFRDDFHSLSADSLAERGWWVSSKDAAYWDKRGERAGCLTLYTLKGDNWPDPAQSPIIRNLLRRRLPDRSFTLEWHLEQFIPHQNWQQAGVLLSEDTGFDDRSLRISIAYNDYNGVYPRSGTILVQAILSRGGVKPEEIAHVPLFREDSLQRNPALLRNLEHTALRVVKEGERLRILYADGILANTSFKQIASYDLPVNFKYVGLFALKGFVDSADDMPVRFSYFSLEAEKLR
jgi:hypothetical protein